MTRGQKALMIVIGILVLILVVLIVFSRPKTNGAAPVPNDTTTTNQPVGLPVNTGAGSFNTNVAANVNTAPAPVQTDSANNLRRIGAAFSERYGSFSNTGNYQNLLDLGPFMTASLRAETEAYVEAQRAKPASATYSGTTSRAISVDVDSLSEEAGTAVLTVNTQRFSRGSTAGSEEVYYQSLKLTFTKASGSWLVNSATWQPR